MRKQTEFIGSLSELLSVTPKSTRPIPHRKHSEYSEKGHLPFTEEETKMTLIPIGGGPKIRFQKGIINLYIGLGPVFYVYQEKNPIGIAKGTGAGVIGQAGCYFNIASGLLFDLSVNYSYCSVKPQKIKADLGGIQAGLSLGYEF